MTRFAASWLIAVTVGALALFYVSHTVERLEEGLAREQHAILQHQEAIHVLEAEWSYLNQPRRIADLAQRYLALAPLSADHVVGIKDLPQRLELGNDDVVPGVPPPSPAVTPAQPTLASMWSAQSQADRRRPATPYSLVSPLRVSATSPW